MPPPIPITGYGVSPSESTAIGVGKSTALGPGVAPGESMLVGVGWPAYSVTKGGIAGSESMAVGVGYASTSLGESGVAGSDSMAIGVGQSNFQDTGVAGSDSMAIGVGFSTWLATGVAFSESGATGDKIPHVVGYNIYWNGGDGGPIIYSPGVGLTTALSWNTGPLAYPSDNEWLVRPYDESTGLEDQNGDARVRVVLNATGEDITGYPNAPIGLTIIQKINGSGLIRFGYNPGGEGGEPTRFDAYIGTSTPNYAVSIGSTTYYPNRVMSIPFSGLTAGTTYVVGVRAENADGQEANTNTISFTVPVAPPSAVQSLTVTVGP